MKLMIRKMTDQDLEPLCVLLSDPDVISNAVCHRSYLSPGSIQVAIYDDRLEVTSPGRLSPDLTIEHLIEGNSRVRNIAIGAAFQYMHIIER